MNPNFTLKNKLIFVTGASSGIGKQIALSAAEQQAKLIITGRDKNRLDETCILTETSTQSIIADLNHIDDRNRIVNSINALDGIVFASGVLHTLPFKFISEDSLHFIMQTNFYSPVLLLASLIRSKKLKKGASVIFISSIGGNIVGTIGNSMYAASKAAINGIVKPLALELANQKIRVNCISPGMIKTNLWSGGVITEEQLINDEVNYPLGYGTEKDVANASVFLLSEASKWITGSNIVLDGGFSIK